MANEDPDFIKNICFSDEAIVDNETIPTNMWGRTHPVSSKS